MENSRWAPLPGWENFYEVSDAWQVRSVARCIFARHPHGYVTRRSFSGHVLRQFKAGKGYRAVKLSRPGAAPKTIYVHRAVAAAFIGPKPTGLETCHGDGNKENNSVDNLRYDTRSANARDALRHRGASA